MHVLEGFPPEALILTTAEAKDAVAWDAFVDNHPEGRFCQLWGYRDILRQAYGYVCKYYTLMAGNQCVGLFPSIVLRRGGGRLISQPFQEYGGPLFAPATHLPYARIAELLLEASLKQRCKSLEIRGGIGCDGLADSPLCAREKLYSYAVLNLANEEEMWRNSLTNEARKGVNRARKAGLSSEIRRGDACVEPPFYDLYLDSMKRLGVPPHAKKFFVAQARIWGDRLVSCWIKQGDQTAAILLGVVTGQRIQIYITVSLPTFYSGRPNDLAHWELIRWAAHSKLRLFDFGSARYEGQIQFKKKWGVTLFDYYHYVLRNPGASRQVSSQVVDTSSTFMTTAAKIWKAAVPLRFTQILGPPIRKYLTK